MPYSIFGTVAKQLATVFTVQEPNNPEVCWILYITKFTGRVVISSMQSNQLMNHFSIEMGSVRAETVMTQTTYTINRITHLHCIAQFLRKPMTMMIHYHTYPFT